MNNKVEKKYIRNIKKYILFKNEDAKNSIEFLTNQVRLFIEEKPNSSYSDIVSHFGEPVTIACDINTSVGFNSISKIEKISSISYKKIFISFTAVMLIIYISFLLASSYISNHANDYVLHIDVSQTEEQYINE